MTTKDGKTISSTVVCRLWSGKMELYEPEFEGKNMTYKEYLKIVGK